MSFSLQRTQMQQQELNIYLEYQTSLTLEYKMNEEKDYQTFAKGIYWSQHPLLPTTQETTLHMDITMCSILKSDWLYSFLPEDGVALYSQQKQDQELTVAQFMDYLLQRHYFSCKGPNNQRYGFSSSHLWMLELDDKKS